MGRFLGLEDTLAGYNPQGRKELYTTETAEHTCIHTLTHTHTHIQVYRIFIDRKTQKRFYIEKQPKPISALVKLCSLMCGKDCETATLKQKAFSIILEKQQHLEKQQCASWLQLRPTLCIPMDSSLPGSCVHGGHMHGVFSMQEYWNGLPCPLVTQQVVSACNCSRYSQYTVCGEQTILQKLGKIFLCVSFSCLSRKYKLLFHNTKFEKIEELFFLVTRIQDLLS